MAYTSQYNYLTVHWLNGSTAETGQFGLKFIGDNLPSQTMVDDAAAAVSTFWSAALSYILPAHALSYLRLARIGTDGNYVPDGISYDHVYSPSVSGGGTAAVYNVAQAAHCVTLRTAIPRGLAHAGRCYLPPLALSVGTDWLWPISNVNNRLNGFATMLSALSGSNLGLLAVMSKGSPTHPAGVTANVTYINSDTRPDVQRRRARSLVRAVSANWNVS